MEKIKNFFSAVAAVIVAVLAALFMLERGKRRDAEAENLSNDLNVADATLKEKQRQLEADIAAKKQCLLDEKAPELKDLTPEEVIEYWKKRQ